ncbi:rhodanese-like domain-containing protein [Thiomicrorhabdus cannonii]|uniref:rhodanese-like domain-containing protein n=1 Tax=Thiomicrorhabdus cannonii TaxID=2748011 RepID=UPI0015BA85FC|nr:rhodanese-like domain-containing protein [Thiomicrorhabdus cannonii]
MSILTRILIPFIGTSLLIFACSLPAADTGPVQGRVFIAPGVLAIPLELHGEKWLIQRNQDPTLTLTPLYTNTTVGYLQPIKLAFGVDTIGELELLDYLQKMQHDDSIALIDTRPFQSYERLHIPGAVNIPLLLFKNELSAIETLEREFNVTSNANGELNFDKAKTLIAYSNGHFCAMTPYALKNARYALLKLGYPPQKIKYYRGGMQDWTSVGLTSAGQDHF